MATEFKLSYTGNEINEKLGKIDSLATKNEVPTKTSQLNNDSGFITSYTETDPTVPAWAKASTKPTYTASEVGAEASGTANSLISAHNTATDAHTDIRTALNNKLSSSELQTAINTSLAQAKASGEFDGQPGKTAYAYAQDGGYTGTEEEFAAKLAEGPLIGMTTEITPTQVADATAAGRNVVVMYPDKTFGVFGFTAFDVQVSLELVYSSAILMYSGMYAVVELIGDLNSNTWQPFVIQQVATINNIPTKVSQLTNDSEYMTLDWYQFIAPTALKNPSALTINGVSYDGSSAVDMTEKVNALIDAKLSAITNAEEVPF
jgi:hypothetical protein